MANGNCILSPDSDHIFFTIKTFNERWLRHVLSIKFNKKCNLVRNAKLEIIFLRRFVLEYFIISDTNVLILAACLWLKYHKICCF